MQVSVRTNLPDSSATALLPSLVSLCSNKSSSFLYTCFTPTLSQVSVRTSLQVSSTLVLLQLSRKFLFEQVFKFPLHLFYSGSLASFCSNKSSSFLYTCFTPTLSQVSVLDSPKNTGALAVGLILPLFQKRLKEGVRGELVLRPQDWGRG